jgi:predicted secreted protein
LATTNHKRASEKTGGGGTASFTFIPCEKGITLTRMLYKRPWDKINAKEVLYEVTIEDQSQTTKYLWMKSPAPSLNLSAST